MTWSSTNSCETLDLQDTFCKTKRTIIIQSVLVVPIINTLYAHRL